LAPDVSHEVTQVLDRATRAWNAGVLADFLACYLDSADTVYVSQRRVLVGFREIARLYHEECAGSGPTAPLGHRALATTILRVTALGRDYALAVGRFELAATSSRGRSAHGVFSLVLTYTAAGWRIVADHSS
jgi:ketosteroid isomerase-like protein